MAVTYEWVIETLSDGDIIDVNHADSYAEALTRVPTDGTPWQIGVVRDDHNAIDGDLEDRAWAYVADGTLPMRFDNGRIVPQRFHKEVKNNRQDSR